MPTSAEHETEEKNPAAIRHIKANVWKAEKMQIEWLFTFYALPLLSSHA